MDGCFLDQRAREGREGTVRWEVNGILSAGAAQRGEGYGFFYIKLVGWGW